MRRGFLIFGIGLVFIMLPGTALAQSAIAGVVKDATGAVLPGVTVEASSPALIEKVRSATTNEAGQYRIVDLRPGTYAVTFTLPGFSTVVREGILLEANFTAPINADMRVGGLAESITVSGETPIVDVQTSTRREVVSQQMLESIPTGRNFQLMANTVPAVSSGVIDVGGSSAMWTGGSLLVHGSLSGDSRTLIDGMVVDAMFGAGQCACVYDNEAQTQEMAVQVTGGAAENQLSGVLVNRIPRTGGNRFSGDALFQFANGSTQGVNLDDALRARGISTPDKLYRDYDVNYSAGGPIVKDKLWFFVSGRNWAYNNYVANAFRPDGSQAIDDNNLKAFPARLTYQASQKNRVTAMFDWTNKVRGHRNLSPTVSPEAAIGQAQPAQHILQAKWTSTISNHLLFETGYSQSYNAPLYTYEPEVAVATCFTAFALCGPGTNYGGVAHVDTLQGNRNTVASAAGAVSGSGPAFMPALSHVYMASLSYVSGAHNLKGGLQHRWGYAKDIRPLINGDSNQLYQNGRPFAIDVFNTPFDNRADVNADLGIFVQDTWTTRRLSLSPGFRWDHFNSSIPAQDAPAGRFVAARHFDAIPDVPNWNNYSPRFGASYDVTGQGRTALKGNVGVYVQSQGPGFASTYNPLFFSTDRRTWTDPNGDDIAQESELGPTSNLTFGVRRNQNPDPDIKRPFQWVWDIGVQHEVVRGLAVTVSFNQRSFHEITWTNNLALDPSDYLLLGVADPRDASQTLPIYSVSSTKFGQVNELDTNSDLNRRMFRGVDATFNLRLPGGGALTGGTSTGHTVTTTCEVEDLNATRFCDQTQYDIPFLTAFKLSGTYPLIYGIRVAGSFQSTPGSERSITYQVVRALVPGLSQASVSVRLNQPGTLYNDRINQLDFSLSKAFRAAGAEVRPTVDLFNMLNANPVTGQVNAYGSSLNNVTAILAPRLVRFGVTVKF
ncbi:MAG: TonB-dependent receptor [Acidobacteriota bacterium]